MSQESLNEEYWSNRYSEGRTGWDLGEASPALMQYCTNLDRDTRILIPGAGNAYEYDALLDLGFTQVCVIDISPAPLKALRERHPEQKADFVQANFFDYIGAHDLILEQTFFCALDPSLRPAYVEHMHSLLTPTGGTLAGLLFDRTFDRPGPAFGGSRTEYEALFTKKFDIHQMATAQHSVSVRQGFELFIEMSPR